ncbi:MULTISPECIES: GNAT family N-acetyltransferase [unclassified Methanoculleus]|jgi:phosphinothricin acetyltransferase|uniref:N-acetyltransferase family protein n=1 Tax=Methanoculleus palmolei TaxID=72612 RepID=A0ABD8A7W8_9EURY|nr:GNAT family N-acetyltransferase [Methanoculleus sp. UBA377]MDD2473203.1 GNAT family N-acetyltransferase [Methanoculleus sp.]WOX55123.1 N-acetyltransferase family protein [Methanoculleus palmolei]
MTIEFRPVREEDLPIIAEIYNYYSLHTTATFHDGEITLSELIEDFPPGDPVYQAYLIRDGDEVLGYCGLRRYKKVRAYDRTAEITIYLKSEYTGRGIGKSALSRLEEHAKRAGLCVILGTVTGENRASIRLFEATGYSRCAYLKNIGEISGKVLDVVMYQKELEPKQSER